MKAKSKRIVYFDAMESDQTGPAFFEGAVRALESSKYSDSAELIPFRFNYGDRKFSPRLMLELARDAGANAIILSGSEKNVSETGNAWVNDYLFGLKNLLSKEEDLPVFGICFGHHALAQVFEGEVSRFQMELGFKEINLSHMASYHPALKNIDDTVLKLGVSHGDQIIRKPEGFHLIASSNYCEVQGLAHDTRPILTLQSHPEITPEFQKVTRDKEVWEKYSAQDFDEQHGPKVLSNICEWLLEA